VAAGATLEAGGTRDGRFYKPTVLSNVKPGMRVFDEEPFGPVANLIAFKTDEEAIALANNQQGSLAAGIICKSISRAMAIGAQLKSGMVHINDQTINDECVNPFGGPGVAGNGGAVGDVRQNL
jgi:benzaldehyde dehydrogenase (NAD)